LLNGFFGCLVPAVQAAGGEVLKFMGDGLLAIFPAGDRDEGPSCGAALSAVQHARHNLAAHNDELAEAGHARLRFGAGLHFGNVVYGNIGAAGRLDFTAIGPSVNRAARLQELSRELGCELAASAAIASACAGSLVPLGRHQLAGFAQAEDVFGLAGGAA
jgi:adenylate cyclase